MSDVEVWKDIDGYEGLYQISSRGRVKGMSRRTRFGHTYRTWKERILSPCDYNGKSYPVIVLVKNGVRKTKYIHSLVADAFIPNSNKLPIVHHKDGNKRNACVENLERVTYEENNQHAMDTGLRKVCFSGCVRERKPVSLVRGIFQFFFESVNHASRITGISRTTIWYACKNKSVSRDGSVWRFT